MNKNEYPKVIDTNGAVKLKLLKKVKGWDARVAAFKKGEITRERLSAERKEIIRLNTAVIERLEESLSTYRTGKETFEKATLWVLGAEGFGDAKR